MAMIARPELAAAVSEAGGLGTIGCDINPPDVLRDHVRQTRALTDRPYGVDLIGDFLTDAHLDVLIEEQVAVAIFFWTFPTYEQVRRLKSEGILVWMQVGSVAEAGEATALGADALIVQGAEAGGHNRAEASTMTLFPRIRRLNPDLPLLAPVESSTEQPWPRPSCSGPMRSGVERGFLRRRKPMLIPSISRPS